MRRLSLLVLLFIVAGCGSAIVLVCMLFTGCFGISQYTRDVSGVLHSDSGSFGRPSWRSDSPNYLGTLYDLEFSKWVEVDDSVMKPIEVTILKGNHGQIFLSIGMVQQVGHYEGGMYRKMYPLEYRAKSKFDFLGID